jgi:hypothetical protein
MIFIICDPELISPYHQLSNFRLSIVRCPCSMEINARWQAAYIDHSSCLRDPLSKQLLAVQVVDSERAISQQTIRLDSNQ